MKASVVIGLILLWLCISAQAQAPQGINYQGVARDLEGQPLSQKEISVRISILNGSADGEVEYDEIHEIRTNSFGLFSLVIGKGLPGTGSFNFIGWTSGNKWLQVELDENGGRNFKLMGSQQFMSVPYALYAERSGNGYQAGQGINIENNMISNSGDGDDNATNELITDVVFGTDNKLRITDAGGTKEADLSGLMGAGQNLSGVLTQGNSAGNNTITNLGAPLNPSDATTKAYVDAHTDGDASSTNELQSLSQVLSVGNDAGATRITNVGSPTQNADAATKQYVDNLDATDSDKSITNEIQTLSKTGSTVSLSTGGGSIVLNDDSPTNEIQNISTASVDANTRSLSITGGSTINVDVRDADASVTNEIQNLSQVLSQGNDAGGTKISNIGAPTVNSDAATKIYVDNLDAADADKSASNEIQNLSSVLTQSNNAGGLKITNLGAPTINSDATTKLYVDNLDAADADKSAVNEIQNLNQVLTQSNNAGGLKIANLGAPTVNTDATTKLYVDNLDATDGDKSSVNELQNLSQVLSTGSNGGGAAITNIANPTNAQDAATKNYVDAADALINARISSNYAFKVNYNHTHSAPVTQVVTIETEDLDDFSVISSNRFTAPENGTYSFTVSGVSPIGGIPMQIRITPIAGPIELIDIKRQIGYPNSSIINYYDSTILKLNTGDVVELIVTSTIINEVVSGSFSGFKL